MQMRKGAHMGLFESNKWNRYTILLCSIFIYFLKSLQSPLFPLLCLALHQLYIRKRRSRSLSPAPILRFYHFRKMLGYFEVLDLSQDIVVKMLQKIFWKIKNYVNYIITVYMVNNFKRVNKKIQTHLPYINDATAHNIYVLDVKYLYLDANNY